jgi:hypothetical protein
MDEKENKSYPFYDYLSFLWEKKRWVVGITATALVIAIIVSLFVKATYGGTVLFNVADATDDRVTVPDIILSNYQGLLPEELRSSLEVVVPKYKQVQISLSGRDSKQVSKGLEKVTKAYYAELQKVYKQRRSLSETYITTLEQRVDALEKAAKVAQPSSSNTEAFTNLQNELATRQEQLHASKIDLSRMQSPIVVPPASLDNLVITKQSTPWKGNIIVALAAGLLISIVVITLWKYILEAKASRREN